ALLTGSASAQDKGTVKGKEKGDGAKPTVIQIQLDPSKLPPELVKALLKLAGDKDAMKPGKIGDDGKKFDGKKPDGKKGDGKKFDGKKGDEKKFDGKKGDEGKGKPDGKKFDGKKSDGKKTVSLTYAIGTAEKLTGGTVVVAEKVFANPSYYRLVVIT